MGGVSSAGRLHRCSSAVSAVHCSDCYKAGSVSVADRSPWVGQGVPRPSPAPAGHLQRVQLHWSTARYAPGQDRALLDGLADLVLDGQVKEIGVSNVGPQGLRWMHQRLAARGIRLSSVQVQYSLLAPGDARLEQILQASRELGVDVLAYSLLAFGILCQPVDVDRKPTTALRRRVFNRLLPASQELRVAIQSIARARQVTMVQVALNWCRSNGTIPIPGLRTPEQALDVAAALKWSLTTEEKQRLDRLRERCAVRMPDNPFQSA